jgi:hypothetical protein
MDGKPGMPPALLIYEHHLIDDGVRKDLLKQPYTEPASAHHKYARWLKYCFRMVI